MTDNNLVDVPVADIRLGAVCKFDILDDNGLLLLSKGKPMTDTMRGQICERGVSVLRVDVQEADALLGRKPKTGARKKALSEAPLSSRRIDRSREPFSQDRADRFNKQFSEATDRVAAIGDQMRSLSNAFVGELCELPQLFISALIEDADQSLFATGDIESISALADRCTQMSLMSLNTGIEMKLPDSDVLTLGIAALIHDMALFDFPAHFHDPAYPLDSADQWEYRRHSTAAYEAFSRFTVISEEIRVLASQVHEKIDGSGFPRGLHKNSMHPLAKILSIVDSYLTLVHPGAGRLAFIPHDALWLLLIEAKRGVFDTHALRAFINQLTLFPIGSEVELNNGERATVIRRDAEHCAFPIVRPIKSPTKSIALRQSELAISRPTIPQGKTQQRIDRDKMSTISMVDFER